MDLYGPLGMLIETKKRPHRLCPARPNETGKADNLAFFDVEGNIVESARPAEVFDFKNDLPRREHLL